MVILYGIKNCTNVRKAQHWLTERQIAHFLHDYRRDGLDTALLERLCQPLGGEHLINRRGTTWRRLALRDNAVHDADAIRTLLLAHPTLIKRPILQYADHWLLGFDETAYQALFACEVRDV